MRTIDKNLSTLLRLNAVQIGVAFVVVSACVVAGLPPSFTLGKSLIVFAGLGSACAAAWCVRQLFK